ncbi:MAG: prolyl oligopeptidase family serine peptidase [Gemmatimonadaceae bacterium]
MRQKHRALSSLVRCIALGTLLAATPRLVPGQTDSLSIARIWDSGEFSARGVTQIRWFDDATYTTLEPSRSAQGARDLVKHNAATGQAEILVAATSLLPTGASAPLNIANYVWSSDKSQLLIFTNTRRVWRVNSRGDYWVYNLATKALRKLGGPDAPPSTLMFAKFTADGRRVAHVRQNLADKGYLVMSLDNRGTPAPRGRAWRKSIYGNVGVLSAQEQANGLRSLIAKYRFVDSTRIGIWGWSGGGSMTLNMLFRYPDLYHTGMAVASVPDLRLYDTIYRERYAGLPDADSVAYARGSPLNFAQNLKGNLLLVHGSGDDNLHYQGSERLVNDLVRHGKQFQLMVYPNRTHGIFEGEGTTVHVYSLLTRYLLERLPAGGRPAM